MCNEVMRNNPYTLVYAPNHLKNQGMCNFPLGISSVKFNKTPRKLQMWSHLLKKSLLENLNFFVQCYDTKFMDDAVRKLAWKHLEENTVVEGDMMIDIRTGKILGPEVDYTCC